MHLRLFCLAWACLAVAACSSGGTNFVAGRQALIRGEPDNALAFFERTTQEDPTYVVTSAPPRKSIWTYVGRARYNAGQYAEARVAFDKALSHVKDDYIASLYRGLTMLRTESPAPPANAFTLQEVTYALREGVAPRRVSTLARERGVAFDLNAETENQLKSAGADTALLVDLKAIRAERISSNKPNNDQLNAGANEVAAALTSLRDWLVWTIAYTTQGRYWDSDGEIRAEIARGLKLAAATPRDFAALLASSERVGYRFEAESDIARRDEAVDSQRQRR